jgi:hypothetical protein
MVLATGAAVGVLASAYYLGSSPLLAVDETKGAPIDKDANWKEKWRARYNDKIKNWSTPEKIFNVFATVRKVCPSPSLLLSMHAPHAHARAHRRATHVLCGHVGR